MLPLILLYYSIFTVAFWVPSIILFSVDMWKLWFSYKIQPKMDHAIMPSYKKCIRTVLWNSLFVLFPIAIMAYLSSTTASFSFLKSVLDLFISVPLVDFFFYVFHRLFHLPIFYNRFHKKHHEITAPIGISALYMTPTDLFIGNIVPVYLPMVIVGAHPVTICIWMFITTVNTVLLAHSGFTWLADFHDTHHSHFSKNFGTNIFMDRLLNTFRASNDDK